MVTEAGGTWFTLQPFKLQGEMDADVKLISHFIESRILAHSMVSPTFRLDLSYSINLSWKTFS